MNDHSNRPQRKRFWDVLQNGVVIGTVAAASAADARAEAMRRFEELRTPGATVSRWDERTMAVRAWLG
ncbi:MAG TPA: hypothetical protein VNN09_09780 [Candidatus Competibacteraceae bacterium]|nr:hypothetical protein [Candidatus Competibacteraceae bacterium]